MTDIFYKELCRFNNLYDAWRHVRKSAQQSSNEEIRDASEEFEVNAPSKLRSIQGRLTSRSYKFPPAHGVLKDKKQREKIGKKPRPIVIASIEGRVVQRAILQVLQPRTDTTLYNHIGKIREINESPYGIGGIPYPYGGVKAGIGAILKDINEGYDYFFKSDIKAFFTCIKHEKVSDFIIQETKDELLTEIFSAGLSLEIGNKEELNEYFELFPQNGKGVPQGSSLSAFAGNVLLYALDKKLNSMGTRMYRYIDDLIILGKDNASVHKARTYASKWLKKEGMSLYPPKKGSDKAEEGNIQKGFIFLGCKIYKNQLEPSPNSKASLISKIENEIKKGKRNISLNIKNPEEPRKTHSVYAQTLSKIDRIIYGWGKSFSFCNNSLPFHHFDKKIDILLSGFFQWYSGEYKSMPPIIRRRTLGVSLLQDIDSTFDDVSPFKK